MPEHQFNAERPGDSTFTLTIDERVAVMLRRSQMDMQMEVNNLASIGTRSARMATHEQAHLMSRLGGIAQALEEGRLVLGEPTEDNLIDRMTVDVDLAFGPDAPEPDA